MIAEKQKELIEFLVDRLKIISGVKALYLKGSIARNQCDDFSDVDFYCLVSEEIYNELLEKREEILGEYKHILYKSEVNFGIEQIIIIFDDNIHLDFYLTTEAPASGLDEIKPLYDPKQLLSNYCRNKNEIESKELIRYLNEAIYTLQEIDVAYHRKDNLWLMRLMSHMLADISLVLCHAYDSEKPVLHMKGLYRKLPLEIKSKADNIMNFMTPDNSKNCVMELIELLEVTVEKQNNEVRKLLHLEYIEYMRERVKKYN